MLRVSEDEFAAESTLFSLTTEVPRPTEKRTDPRLHAILPETVEIPDHPWFIGVQFHPELKSRPFEPHPLFVSFIGAAVTQSRLV
mgnify:CR=1 FL=1